MTPQLIQILAFENVAPGASQILPHNININGIPQQPDFAVADIAGAVLNVTKTTVELFNSTGANMVQPHVWLELKHSMPREIGKGADPFEGLDPRPFIPATSDGRGPFMLANVSADATGVASYNVVSVAHAPNSGIYEIEMINALPPPSFGTQRATVTLGLNTTDIGLIAYEWIDQSHLRVRTWIFGDGVWILGDIGFSAAVELTITNP